MKVAVVGSGVSGLASTWLLNEHSKHEVHLYEADDRPGGHANTIQFSSPGNEPVDVDVGFIVFNPDAYPNFLHFLQRYPNVEILPTSMTFSISRDQGVFEWAGHNLSTIFCQRFRLLDPKMWRLIYDVLRFNACARRLIIGWDRATSSTDDMSVGEYLLQEGYSEQFATDYLLPISAAVWTTPPDKLFSDFPIRTLVQYLNNHNLLQVVGAPKWLTIKKGSQQYVQTILSSLPKSSLHLSTPVRAVQTTESGKVLLTTADGKSEEFDHVIMATHTDTTLSILKAGGGVSAEEAKILGSFEWNRNEAVVHSDIKLMPKTSAAWSCWNYITRSSIDEEGIHKANHDDASLTYWMNYVQHLPAKKHGYIFVTLNPPYEIDSDTVFQRIMYEHPVIDGKAVLLQRQIPSIQNIRGISYAGGWMGYGFHEDGFTSGLRAVMDSIPDIDPPFEIQYPDRQPHEVAIARVFDFLETDGRRAWIGSVLSVCLGFVSRLLSPLLGSQNDENKTK